MWFGVPRVVLILWLVWCGVGRCGSVFLLCGSVSLWSVVWSGVCCVGERCRFGELERRDLWSLRLCTAMVVAQTQACAFVRAQPVAAIEGPGLKGFCTCTHIYRLHSQPMNAKSEPKKKNSPPAFIGCDGDERFVVCLAPR
jgi:hypothetical protein